MRDIERIDRMCGKLAEVWKLVPDWRFMQLVCNMQRMLRSDGFYMEDDMVENFFENMIVGFEKEDEDE